MCVNMHAYVRIRVRALNIILNGTHYPAPALPYPTHARAKRTCINIKAERAYQADGSGGPQQDPHCLTPVANPSLNSCSTDQSGETCTISPLPAGSTCHTHMVVWSSFLLHHDRHQ